MAMAKHVHKIPAPAFNNSRLNNNAWITQKSQSLTLPRNYHVPTAVAVSLKKVYFVFSYRFHDVITRFPPSTSPDAT